MKNEDEAKTSDIIEHSPSQSLHNKDTGDLHRMTIAQHNDNPITLAAGVDASIDQETVAIAGAIKNDNTKSSTRQITIYETNLKITICLNFF